MKPTGRRRSLWIGPGLVPAGILAAVVASGIACRSTSSTAAATPRPQGPGGRVLVTGSNLPFPAAETEGTLPSTPQTVRRIPASEIESKGRGSLVDALRLHPQIR